jgi:peptide/nickel transport system substrate-binding protein
LTPGAGQGRNSISIAFRRTFTWDPNARVLASAQSLYKCVFDSPIDQAPDLSIIPSSPRAGVPRGRLVELELELRDDALFHIRRQGNGGGFPLHLSSGSRRGAPAVKVLDRIVHLAPVKDIEIARPPAW